MIQKPPKSPQTAVTRPFDRPAPVTTPSPAPVARKTGPLDPLPYVIELRIVGTPDMLQLQVKDTMLFGRADVENGIRPEIDLTPYQGFQNGVSRRHAQLILKNDCLYLRDLGSTNGTLLNGMLCHPETDYRVRHGDDISLGKLRMQVMFSVVPMVNPTPETQEAEAKPPTGTGQHVLVLEDDKEVGSVFKMALEQAGYKVTVVQDVAKALGVCFYKLPDAIILDLMLPDMNGMDFVRYIRKQYPDKRVPMLVCSSATAGYQAQQALSAGADDFLGKPIAVEALVAAVDKATKKQ